MTKLILPEEKYWKSFQKGLQEFKDAPTPYDTQCVRKGFDFSSFPDYKKDCENTRNGITLKPQYVPSTTLWLIDNEKVVGIFEIRHRLTPFLEIQGGHIAYAILPSFRQKGYATQGLKLCCQYAHDVLSIEDVLISCHEKNIASYKTMKKVMIEFGGLEASPTTTNEHEEKRVWIRTKPRPVQIRPLAVAVIKRGNKILALKGYDDTKKETFYRLIGGGIEFGEKGEETVKREFIEEFGFEPINIKYLKTIENIFTFNTTKGHEIVLVYEADLPLELAHQEKFYGKENRIKDKFAEFVALDKGYKIYPCNTF